MYINMISPVYTTTYINKNINNICFFAEYIDVYMQFYLSTVLPQVICVFFLMPTISCFRTALQHCARSTLKYSIL